MQRQSNDKMGFKETIKNTAFVMKFIFKNVPLLFFAMLLAHSIWVICGFITNTYVLRYVISSYENNGTYKSIFLTVILLIAVPALFRIIFNFFSTVLDWWVTVKLGEKIYAETWKQCKNVELSCYENPDFYDKYVCAIEETCGKFLNINWYVISFITTILSLVLYGSMLFTIDPIFIIFALIPLIVSIFKRKQNEIEHKHSIDDRMANRRRLYAQRIFYDADYAKEMRLTNAKNFMLERYDIASEERKDVIRKYGIKEMFLEFVVNEFKNIIANPLTMLYAVYRTLVKKTLGIGDCAVIINSSGQITESFTGITSIYFNIHQNAIFIRDYRTFLAYESKLKETENARDVCSGDIKLTNVSFKYDGSEEYTLKNITMEIKKGEKIALVGHNGAGKSTLIKLLLRLYDVTDGEITLNKENIKDLKIKEYRDLYSVVLQDFKTIALPVIDNVLMRPRQEGDREKVEQALRLSGVYDRIMQLPNGIDTLLTKEFDKEGAVLSVGESQKLAIAHAFLKDSPFIILDEPTSALDPIAENEMYNNMMKAGENKSMIFISHRLSSAVSCDRIYMLENGEVIEAGTHKELMSLNGKYADMFRKQAQNYVDEAEVV